ncbi:hypothetical protein VA7868_00165 [Vibrio aerogenes CECT 7868]|uniref:Uncharacterized protein n=1 Tax=Vibrio aerogenes CECT 7868 TaxID=1216006 RepID=A0A1M5UT53_9VIBR|nr:hypothetical protein VA7868_00165 [Vibrio aerogenes CECT 7868]
MAVLSGLRNQTHSDQKISGIGINRLKKLKISKKLKNTCPELFVAGRLLANRSVRIQSGLYAGSPILYRLFFSGFLLSFPGGRLKRRCFFGFFFFI